MIRTRPRVVLVGLLGLAFALRVWGIAFGLPFLHARPDELMIVSNTLQFFTEDLNPGFFDYPGFYFYFLGTLFVVYYFVGRVAGWFTDPTHFVWGPHNYWTVPYLIGRFATAVLGSLTILPLYRIASLVFDRATGLLAAAFLAVAFLHARDSHYATTDVTMTFFVVCAVMALVQLDLTRSRVWALAAGLFAGLAIATKYNAVLLVAPMTLVEVRHVWKERSNLRSALRSTQLPVMAAVMTLVFVASNPYLFLDYPTAQRNFTELLSSLTHGMTSSEVVGGRGWTYHLRFSLTYGLGIPLLVAALQGLMLMAWRHPRAALLLGSFPIAYYLVVGWSRDVFVRYMIPVVPFLCLFGAYFVNAVSGALARGLRMPRPAIATILACLIAAPSAWSIVRLDAILARTDSRVLGAEWIHQNVPRGASIFMSGNRYGHLPLEDRRDPKYRLIEFNYRAGAFVEGGRPFTDWPDWIIVQRSALPYSHIPDEVTQALRGPGYALAHIIRASNADERGNVYDIQDAFYAPYGGFKGVERPGPDLEFYQRRPAGL